MIDQCLINFIMDISFTFKEEANCQLKMSMSITMFTWYFKPIPIDLALNLF